MVTSLETHLTPQGVADRCGVARSGVYQAIAAGRLPALRISHGGNRATYLIRPEDADALWAYRAENVTQ